MHMRATSQGSGGHKPVGRTVTDAQPKESRRQLFLVSRSQTTLCKPCRDALSCAFLLCNSVIVFRDFAKQEMEYGEADVARDQRGPRCFQSRAFRIGSIFACPRIFLR